MFKNLLLTFAIFLTQHFSLADAVPGEFVVRTSVTRKKLPGIVLKQTLNREGTLHLVKSTEAKLRQLKDVELIEPNFIYHVTLGSPPPSTNDPEDILPFIIPGDPQFNS